MMSVAFEEVSFEDDVASSIPNVNDNRSFQTEFGY